MPQALYRWPYILIGWPRVGVSAGAAVGRDCLELARRYSGEMSDETGTLASERLGSASNFIELRSP